MLPFKPELFIGNGERDRNDDRGQFRAIEVVPPFGGFVGDMMEIAGDGLGGIGLFTEAFELRMVSVAAGEAGKHRLRQKPFPPQRHETFCIEISRMKGPETHGRRMIARVQPRGVNSATLPTQMTARIVAALSLLALSFLTMCSSTPADGFQNPSREPVRFGSGGPPLIYVVMGDSTAAGQGAPYQQGIAVGTAQALSATRPVVMTNLGVSGARIHDVVIGQLNDAKQLRPELVLLAVTANDVTHLTPVGSMRADLLTIVHGLRAANPAILIAVTGSPDMGAPPRIPRLLRGLAAHRTESVNRMVKEVAAEEHLTFAPIAEQTGPLFRTDPKFFGPDQFHPNARGYAAWITVLNAAIERARTAAFNGR
jgi:lysophospholipase L1-like esterase